MEESTLKKLQEIEIQILNAVHNICEKNNISYYLIAGTLLGAVRHKGFIPWDDDIDIAMSRKDYCKFIKLCQEGALGNNYSLQHTTTYPDYHLSFAKIRKNNTLFDEEAFKNLECDKGIFIDIFPLDFVKKNKGLWYHTKAKLIKNLSWVIYVRKLKGKTGSLFNKVLYGVTKFLPIQTVSYIRDKMASSCKTGIYYINYGSWYSYTKETMPVSYFADPVLVDFADKKFYAPKKKELVLTRVFGDYMKLPPEEERKNHNPAQVIFDIENNKR